MKPCTRLVLSFALLGVSFGIAAQAQNLKRHVAEFRFGAEQTTAITAAVGGVPDGALIYHKSFFLPPEEHTVFVTLSTTGDAHEGDAHWFSARLNGRFCNSGNRGAGFAPPGWVPLQKHFAYETTYTSGGVGGQSGGDGGGGTGDMHDNGIYYTWCCRDGIMPGAFNRVTIKMATSNAGSPVFVERSHYYIDSVNKELCKEASAIPTIGIGVLMEPIDPLLSLESNARDQPNAGNQ